MQFWPIWAKFDPPNFFFSKNWLHLSLLSCRIPEKTNDLILRKLSDGQTDESDFIGRCPTNVERPIYVTRIFKTNHKSKLKKEKRMF